MSETLQNYIEYSKQLKILFIEDNEDVKEQLLKLLKNLFSNIDVEENGKVALETYIKAKEENKPYDLIISDLNIPGISGFELLEKIKEIEPKQVSVVISAHTEPTKLKKLSNIGVFKFIQKPIEYASFMQTYLEIIDKIKEEKVSDLLD